MENSGGLKHIRITVGENGDLISALQPGERCWHIRERFEPLDLRHQEANLVHCVRNCGALKGVGDSAVPDLSVRRVLPMQECIDHGVLEVRTSPPGHECVRSPVPTFIFQVGCDYLCEALLNVHHRAVLVEHADLDLPLEGFRCHLSHRFPR